jgi:sugar O-acyltransferase (sialic acid O-acetyltransferase NeuD family)
MFNPFYKQTADFRRLYIFGAGGSGREIDWLAEQSWGDEVERVFLVDQLEFLCSAINNIPVQLLQNVEVKPDCRFTIALGDGARRRRAAHACLDRGLLPTTIVHPRAEISHWVSLGEGVVICAGTAISVNVSLGDFVHVNVGCTISHDVSLGEFTTLSPGVHIAGHVQIGRGVFIGTGASIINGQSGQPLIIGDDAVVAAGACVTQSVEAGAMVAGVPAVRKR